MNEGQGPKQGCKECWQDGGWDGVGGQERGCSLGPSGGGLPSSPHPTHTHQRGFLLQSKPRLCRPGAGAGAQAGETGRGGERGSRLGFFLEKD